MALTWRLNCSLQVACALSIWGYALWFLLGFESTGSYVIMLQVIIRDDAGPFFILFAVFIASFSTCFWILDDEFQENFSPGGDVIRNPSGGLTFKLRRSVAAALGGFDLEDYMRPKTLQIGSLAKFSDLRW
jgi:hypothetical protein